MVMSGVSGPTYRLGIFLDGLLQPIVNKYCEGEIVKDSTCFLAELTKLMVVNCIVRIRLKLLMSKPCTLVSKLNLFKLLLNMPYKHAPIILQVRLI